MFKKLFITFALCVALFSCNTEEPVTDCDETVITVKKLAEKYTEINIITENGSFIDGVPFRFEGNFIVADGTFYNLCFLKSISANLIELTLHF